MGEAASERLKQGGVLWPKRSLDIQRAEAGVQERLQARIAQYKRCPRMSHSPDHTTAS